MSKSKTANLVLHSWDATDPVKRTEFNENFNVIDDKIGNLSASVNSNTTQINQLSTSIDNNATQINNLDSQITLLQSSFSSLQSSSQIDSIWSQLDAIRSIINKNFASSITTDTSTFLAV